MELDDMHHAWTTLEHRLDQQAAQIGQLREQAHGHAAHASLRPLWLGQSAQLLCAIALGSVVARSWSGSGDDMAAIIGGVLLQLWCVALSALRQLQRLARLDFAGPLLQTQQALAQPRRWRTRVAPWLGMACWLLWVAVADSLRRRLTGIGLPHRWLLLNAVFGVIGIVGTWYGYRRLQRARHPWLDRLDDAHAGRGMTRATRLLAEIARFRRE
ncbi:hypothetical protein LL965_19430 [Xanthomonas cassavae CFBP 4642]|uniref:Serine/threonine protein kinase n=1 Tax=Xanthomonas cassavae CFBP 4642 TaxID=1219375 RepID=A0ABS8HLB5_9XANT|nr:hypothetical protein [Xanthomonas cassavae]MCC4622116.1 hypothetical protein [Xanthomonas cassavae CFBP 4642]